MFAPTMFSRRRTTEDESDGWEGLEEELSDEEDGRSERKTQQHKQAQAQRSVQQTIPLS